MVLSFQVHRLSVASMVTLFSVESGVTSFLIFKGSRVSGFGLSSPCIGVCFSCAFSCSGFCAYKPLSAHVIPFPLTNAMQALSLPLLAYKLYGGHGPLSLLVLDAAGNSSALFALDAS